MMLMTDDKKDDEATAFYDDRHTSAAAAAEETADRIMVEKFGIAAGRRLRLVVDTPGPNVARAPAPRSTRLEKYTIFTTRRFR